LFELLTHTSLELQWLSYRGLPDLRVLCQFDRPVIAMMRLPTGDSGGRANLHQGAIGAAVDLWTGTVTGAWIGRRPLDRHPDTDVELVGAVVPSWDAVLDAASRCGPATACTTWAPTSSSTGTPTRWRWRSTPARPADPERDGPRPAGQLEETA